MKTETAPSYPVSVFIAGDAASALQACREHCMKAGLCVTVTATEYVYTGGCEAGVIVGLINYPRFPATPDEMDAKALAVAEMLIERLCQHSATVQSPRNTVWLSRRPVAA